MIISLDVDGVLADFSGHLATTLKYDGPTDAFWWPIEAGLFDSKKEFWKWLGGNKEFWLSVPPIEGAVEGVKALKDFGNQLVVTTFRRQEHGDGANELWLADHFGSDLLEGIEYMNPDKTGYSKYRPGVHLHLDDRPEVVWATMEDGQSSLLLDQPFNQHDELVPRVMSWADFVDEMELAQGFLGTMEGL